mmetsp:Transcript_42071/g.116199  ORF Transcript_42071/g.116199 Transcript_42071/m.116199 type:complete len:316 (+) Transcript_42071:976-1923(+)
MPGSSRSTTRWRFSEQSAQQTSAVANARVGDKKEGVVLAVAAVTPVAPTSSAVSAEARRAEAVSPSKQGTRASRRSQAARYFLPWSRNSSSCAEDSGVSPPWWRTSASLHSPASPPDSTDWRSRPYFSMSSSNALETVTSLRALVPSASAMALSATRALSLSASAKPDAMPSAQEAAGSSPKERHDKASTSKLVAAARNCASSQCSKGVSGIRTTSPSAAGSCASSFGVSSSSARLSSLNKWSSSFWSNAKVAKYERQSWLRASASMPLRLPSNFSNSACHSRDRRSSVCFRSFASSASLLSSRSRSSCMRWRRT